MFLSEIWYWTSRFCERSAERLPKACADMSIWRTINPFLFLGQAVGVSFFISLYCTPPRQLFPLIAFSALHNCVSSYHSISKHWEMAGWCCCFTRGGGKGNCQGPFSKTSLLITFLLGSNSQINVLLIDSRMVDFTLPFFWWILFVRSNIFLGYAWPIYFTHGLLESCYSMWSMCSMFCWLNVMLSYNNFSAALVNTLATILTLLYFC